MKHGNALTKQIDELKETQVSISLKQRRKGKQGKFLAFVAPSQSLGFITPEP